MRDIVKTVIIVIVLGTVLATWPAFAFMPTERGAHAPQTAWSDQGVKGTVTGKVVTSLDQTKGVEGAYVALIDPVSQWREYANTTTDADGNYRFTGVNATYSSVLFRGPDGKGESYQQGMNMYTIYVNYSSSEAYSGNFGVDTNRSNNVIDAIVVYTGTPNPDDYATPTPEPTAQPTAQPTAAPTPTPTPTPAPFPGGLLLGGAAAIVVLLAIVAIAAYFLVLRKKKKK